MSILGIIPSRYASSRLPGKPLIDIGGKSMIQRVYEQASKSSSLSGVIVATDDQRIFDHVNSFGGQVQMTKESHMNGTERCAEVASNTSADYYINIQGDEPFIHTEQIDQLASILDGKTQLGTLSKRIDDPDVLNDPSKMKVVINKFSEAMYFSRSCVPFIRDADKDQWLDHFPFLKHIGIYAYRSDILKEITQLSVSPLEQAENLEQLRWLENGFKIKVAETIHESIGIDTATDLEKARAKVNS